MAKINHSNYLDVVDSVWSSATSDGIMHINSEEKSFNGEKFTIQGKELINFYYCPVKNKKHEKSLSPRFKVCVFGIKIKSKPPLIK